MAGEMFDQSNLQAANKTARISELHDGMLIEWANRSPLM